MAQRIRRTGFQPVRLVFRPDGQVKNLSYGLVCILIAAALGAVKGSIPPPAAQAVAGAAALAESIPHDDPFPILRLRATEAQLPDVLKQLDPGPLTRLPRSEFEARVQAAGRALADARAVPRITDARFRAALVGGDLVGTAELDIVNPAGSARFLTLDPLRLALGPATWGDGRAAVVGVPPGASAAAVWVEQSGRQTLKFKWSLAGAAEPGEQRFELRVPAAPSALLDLELPANQVPTAPVTDALVTGPFPAEGAARGWRFRFGGRTRLDFAVRPAGNPGVSAAAALVAKYELAPGQLTCGFEYDLRPAKGTVGEWAFAVDPGLRVTDVVVNNRAGWTLDPPTTPGGPRRLRVTLRQPGAGGKVLVSVVAPFPDPALPPDAPLPVVRPIGALLDDESLEIRLAPGLKFENWNPGDYRTTDSQVYSDQSRTLWLLGTLLAPGADRPFRRLPSFRVAPAETDFTTTEQVAWHFDTDRITATVRMRVRVRRGSLFQFGLHIPAGYALARANSSPEELIAHTATAGSVATVEFARPVVAGQTADLTFEFRGPPLSAVTAALPFPAFAPVGAAERVGVLGIDPGPLWSVEAIPGPGTEPAGWFTPGEPAVPADATRAFRYRGGNPDGRLTLTPIRAEFTADIGTRVVPIAGRLLGTTTFTLRVRTGGLPSVLINETEAGAAGRTWRTVGSSNAAVAIPLPGRHWLIRFARPVTDEVTLETSATRALPADSSPDEMKRLSDAFRGWAIPAATRAPDAAPNPTAAPSDVPRPAWTFTGLSLVTAVQSPDEVVAIFGGTVNQTAGTSLPILLPPGARVQSVGIGGQWLEPGGLQTSDDGVVRLPMPASTPVRFEVRYQLPESHGPIGRVHSPAPQLPANGAEVGRWWVFASDVLPGWPVRAWDRDRATDLPPLLGDSPAAWAGGLVVSRAQVEDVRVAPARAADAVGVAIAAALLALAWAGGRRRHPFCGLVAIAVLLAVASASLLGPPWWQRAAMVPVVVGLLATGAMVVARGRRAVAPVVAAVLLVGLLQLNTQAQPGVPAMVVILPPDADGREVVVAPKAVLDRLANVAKPAAPGVLIGACEYAITADESGARVVAKFTAHALGDGEAVAMLPLADARLERVAVNGAAAFPASPRPGVCAVPLPGKGRHEIEVRFAVSVVGTSPEREVRFGVPESPITRVTADLPGSARQVQVVGRTGQRTATEGERVRVETAAGAVKAVHVRWRDGAGGTASVKVREGCVWDVSEAGAELTACYLVRIDQGAVSTLRFEVPAELDALGVTARALDPGGTAALRDWTLGDAQNNVRLLAIHFQQPTAGRLLLVLTCAPRKAVTRQPVLRFPKPVGMASGDPDAAYGLRAKGVAIDELGRSWVIDFSPDALARDFGGVPDLRLDPNTPVRVFRPTPGGTPELRPTLRPAVELPAATLETAWHVGPQRADATGTIRWSGRDAPEVLEFLLPGVHVLEVRGSDVASWSQAGARVQVWFRRSARDGEIEWTGTVSAPAFPFDTHTPRVTDMRLTTDTVRLVAADGFALRVERDRGWTGSPDELTRTTTNPTTPPVRVLLAPAPRIGRASDFGWLTATHSTRAIPEAPPPRSATPAAGPATRVTTAETGSRWVWPVSVAAGWVVAIVGLAFLLARFPHTTWPEQFALVAALFGGTVFGHWWIGFAAWVAARATVVLFPWSAGLRPAGHTRTGEL